MRQVFVSTLNMPHCAQTKSPAWWLGMLALMLLATSGGADALDEANRLSRDAATAEKADQREHAVALWHQAIERRDALGDRSQGLANDLWRISITLRALGRAKEAIAFAQRELALEEAAKGPEHPAVATSLNNLALLHQDMGQYAQALPLYQRSLAIREKVHGPEHRYVATGLNNLALLHQHMGQYAQALPLFQRSLAILEKVRSPEHPDVATSLNNLAGLHRNMGQYAHALPLYQRSLALYEKVHGPEHPAVATSLNNLALLHHDMGQYPQALPLYQRSLAIREKVHGPEHPEVAQSLNNLAALHRAVSQYVQALPLFERSLAIREKVHGPEHPDVATSLYNLAWLHQAMGQYAQALPLATRAWRIAALSADPNLFSDAAHTLAWAHAHLGQRDLAVFFGKQAVNAVQGIRQGLQTLEQSAQRSFVGTKENTYQHLAGWLIEVGRIPEAQQVLGMLKEEEFFDFVRRDAGEAPTRLRATFTGEEQQFSTRLDEARDHLATIGAELDALEKKAKLGLSAEEQARRKVLEEVRERGRQEFERFLAELTRALGGSERGRALAERNLPDLIALQDTLAALGHGAMTLHYLVLEARTHVILTTAQIQLQRESKVSSAQLNAKITRLREALQNPRLDPRPLARELYALLIAPVAEDLRQAKAQTLMLSLDGALRYLPFGALHDGQHYLAERYALAMYTEAARDRLRERPPAQWQFSGLGLTRAVTVQELAGPRAFLALPAVREELEGIVSAGILPGEAHFDERFTEEQLRASLDRRAPVLHIASHFVFRPGTEADSYLVLGDGSAFSLAQLRRLRFRDVDLITLSACETAVGGGRDANGREIEGFGALAQRQGAKGVLATLWPVADRSTGQFMQALYRLRQSTPGTTKAEALRQAQIGFIRGAQAQGRVVPTDPPRGLEVAPARGTDIPPAFTPDPHAPYAHPYYWAPFILMGNWL